MHSCLKILEAPASKRRPNRDLARSRRGACEQQIGDVHACDEQHTEHGGEQHEERLPDVENELLEERRDGDRVRPDLARGPAREIRLDFTRYPPARRAA